SPTMPSVSPACTSKLTPSTARTGPESVRNQVRRSRTWSNGSAAAGMRIEPIAKAIAHEVEAHHHRQDGQPRKGGHPPLLHQLTPFADHLAPVGRRRYHAQTEKRQPGKRQDGVAEVERDQHDKRPD